MKPLPQLFYILAADVLAIVFLVFLIQRGILSPYPSGAIAFPLLLLMNIFALRKMLRQRTATIANGSLTPSLSWLAATVFTLAGVGALVAFVREPNTAHGVQVGVAILLVGYCWYIVYKLYLYFLLLRLLYVYVTT
jgi:hypothetical protein